MNDTSVVNTYVPVVNEGRERLGMQEFIDPPIPKSPERALIAAILERALADYFSEVDELHEAARDWIFDDEAPAVDVRWTFDEACLAIDIDPAAFRETLRTC